MLEKVRETINAGGIETYIRIIEKETEGDLSTIDIAAALLKLQMEHGTDEVTEKREEVDFADTGAEPGMVRFFLEWAGSTKSLQKISSGRLREKRGFPVKPLVLSGSLTLTHLSKSRKNTQPKYIRL